MNTECVNHLGGILRESSATPREKERELVRKTHEKIEKKAKQCEIEERIGTKLKF